MSMSDAMEGIAASIIFGTVATGWTRDTNFNSLLVKAWNTLPGEDGTGGTEVSGTSYVEVTKANTDNTNWSVTGSVATNVTAITFPQAGGSWGSVNGITVEADDDTLMFIGTFSGGAKTIDTNDTLEIAAGDLDITFG